MVITTQDKRLANRQSKYQARENRAKVRKILLCDWDPIGVTGIPEAIGEYDAYADAVYVMLMDESATASDISGYLFTVATEHMGLTDRELLAEKSDRVARLLVGLRAEFRHH